MRASASRRTHRDEGRLRARRWEQPEARPPARRSRVRRPGPPDRRRPARSSPASPSRRARPWAQRADSSGACREAAARSGDAEQEWCALRAALDATAADILRARASVAGRAEERDAAIFDAHLLFLEDEALLSPARAGIFDRREPAARAWADAVAAAAAAWDDLEDPYQRARAADLRHVGEQVLAHLAGHGAATVTAKAGGIVVAPDLAPAEVAALGGSSVAGIALAGGGPTSHAAILARALGLPAVAGAGAALLAVPDGTSLILDGDAGTVTVAPPPEAVAAAGRRRERQTRDAAAAREQAAAPAVTLDGVAVRVEANISGPEDVPAAVAAGADGVGLLRTEFLFLSAAAMPGEDEQAAAYTAVADALGGRPLTVRTLDAGADKPLPYLALPLEANPFLGVRGLRLGLARPEQLLCQLRAVLRAAASHDVRVMFPMVATVDELRRARGLLDEARASLLHDGFAVPARLEIGVMLEVPSAALLAEKLAPLVDFFSVGTNDLTQYTLAAERGNAGVAGLADPLHPAVLQLIRRTALAAAAEGRRLAVCGEVAGDRLAVPLLLGLGATELSMNAVADPRRQAGGAPHRRRPRDRPGRGGAVPGVGGGRAPAARPRDPFPHVRSRGSLHPTADRYSPPASTPPPTDEREP